MYWLNRFAHVTSGENCWVSTVSLTVDVGISHVVFAVQRNLLLHSSDAMACSVSCQNAVWSRWFYGMRFIDAQSFPKSFFPTLASFAFSFCFNSITVCAYAG